MLGHRVSIATLGDRKKKDENRGRYLLRDGKRSRDRDRAGDRVISRDRSQGEGGG